MSKIQYSNPSRVLHFLHLLDKWGQKGLLAVADNLMDDLSFAGDRHTRLIIARELFDVFKALAIHAQIGSDLDEDFYVLLAKLLADEMEG